MKDISISAEVEGQLVKIRGSLPDVADYQSVLVIAANPINRMTSYSGSGLPFPCQDVAFQDTPNYAYITETTFDLTFSYPNSYYSYDNWTKVPPSVFVIMTPTDSSKEPIVHRHELVDPLVLRTLNYRSGRYEGPSFYARKEDIITMQGAEGVMRAMADAKARHNIA